MTGPIIPGNPPQSRLAWPGIPTDPRWPARGSPHSPSRRAALRSRIALTPPRCEARAQLFVPAPWGGEVGQLQQGSAFTLARVQSYALLVISRQVADPAIGDLGLTATAEELAERVTATAPLDTVLLHITVADTEAPHAAATADALADRLTEVVERLEGPVRPTTGTERFGTPVRLTAVQRAAPPATPVGPHPVANLVVGLLAGLLLGTGLAVLRQRLDTSLTTTAQLAAHTGVPVLGVVPVDAEAAQRPMGENATGRHPWADPFRHLRTNLRFARVGERPGVVVTSAPPGEGRTGTATATALALAVSGTRTCLVDADLRRPGVATRFGLVQDTGLTTAPIGQAEPADLAQRAPGGLAVPAVGPLPPNPGELLASARMGEILSGLADRYEAVVVDAAPVLPVADTLRLAPHAHTLLLVQAARTPRDRVTAATEALAAVGVRLLGAVLTQLPDAGRGAPDHGYGYGYGYGDPVPPRPRVGSGAEEADRTAGAGGPR